jgi:hypothetical protein
LDDNEDSNDLSYHEEAPKPRKRVPTNKSVFASPRIETDADQKKDMGLKIKRKPGRPSKGDTKTTDVNEGNVKAKRSIFRGAKRFNEEIYLLNCERTKKRH